MTERTDLGPMLANIRDYWLGWGAQEHVVTPTALFRSGVGHPLFNGVRQSVHGDSVARVGARLSGVPWMWWLGEDSPVDLAGSLREQGAVEVGTLPLMSAEIHRVPTVATPPDLVVDEVTGDEEIDRWVRMWVPNSDLPEAIAAAVSRVERQRPLPPDGDYVRLAARTGGRIVASAVLTTSHGVAGLYAVSTERSCRRRGIGRAITAAALDVAADRGVRVAVLNPTSQGEPLYRRIGFETVSGYRLFVPPGS